MEIDFKQLEASAVLAGLCLIAVTVATVIDLCAACNHARRRGVPIISHKLRKTVAKLGDYWRLQGLGLCCDVLLSPVCAWPYLTILITLGEVAIEAKSVIETYKSSHTAAGGVGDSVAALLDALTSRDVTKLKDYLNSNKDK